MIRPVDPQRWHLLPRVRFKDDMSARHSDDW